MSVYLRILKRSMSNNSSSGPGVVNVMFKGMFGKYLLVTNTVSSGFLMAVGDIMQQEIEYQRKIAVKRYDWERIGRMLLVGLFQGPCHHIFYNFLDKALPGSNVRTVCKKIVLDQLIASPICIAIFFYGMGLLDGKDLQGCSYEIRKKFTTVYLTDWCVWPPTQFINFYFLPPRYRVMYINFMTMLYDIFLSYIKHVDSHDPGHI